MQERVINNIIYRARMSGTKMQCEKEAKRLKALGHKYLIKPDYKRGSKQIYVLYIEKK